jgi:hypothetical protein
MPAVMGLLYEAFFWWPRNQDEGLAGMPMLDFHRNRICEGKEEPIFISRAGNKRDF